MLRLLTCGESHGPYLGVIIEGIPAGLKISKNDINYQLSRRQKGVGRSARMKIEADQAQIIAGIRFGKTLGSPIGLLIPNKDWENWKNIMAIEDITNSRKSATPVTLPRPGHADLAGVIKYAHKDIRNVLERASARETAARVAAGAIALKLLAEFNIEIISHVIQIGPIKANLQALQPPEIAQLAESSPIRCADKTGEAEMIKLIEKTAAQGNSLGGVFELIATNIPPGLGSYVHYDRRLDARLAFALMSIPAIKGVEIGLGFGAAALPGSQVHDEIFYTPQKGFFRKTNRAGGLEGGVTTGEPIILRAAMKPVPTLKRPLKSVDLISKTPGTAHAERADICAVPSAAVIGEAVVAIELANAMLEKFGADSIQELHTNYNNYMEYVKQL